MTEKTFGPASPVSELQLEVRVIIFTLRQNRLQVLLVSPGLPPFSDPWELPGSQVLISCSLEETASQCLSQCTGVNEAYLEQLYTYGDPVRGSHPRLVSVAYFALIPAGAKASLPDDAQNVRWFPMDALPELKMDHDEIILYALRRLRYKLEYSAVGFQLLPENFSLSELQRTYEMILGESLDKRNFRRRILEAGIIEPTPLRRVGEGRPAILYRYRPDAVAEVKARRLFP